jgi:hypothetical protein
MSCEMTFFTNEFYLFLRDSSSYFSLLKRETFLVVWGTGSLRDILCFYNFLQLPDVRGQRSEISEGPLGDVHCFISFYFVCVCLRGSAAKLFFGSAPSVFLL